MGTLSETAVSTASTLIRRRDDQAIGLSAGLTTDFLDRSHRPLFLMRPILESPRATLNKSRDGARAISGWGARHHLRWPQAWRGHSGSVQRCAPPETGILDARGLVQRSPNQTASHSCVQRSMHSRLLRSRAMPECAQHGTARCLAHRRLGKETELFSSCP